MYNEFFGLKQNPFNMTPDPAFLFFTPRHREALAGLVYATLEKRGFIVLTGPAGTGKTTLVSKTLHAIPADTVRTSLIQNPTLTTTEFLEMVLLDFGIADIPASKALRLAKLHAFLLEGHRAGQVTALIVDEAHKLSTELLEEIRLLGNFEFADHKLLQILLIGQSELMEILSRPDLQQFKQRISMYLALQPLSKSEIEAYVNHRWSTAGGLLPAPFTPEAVSAIGEITGGIPRIINAVADNGLLLAFGEGSHSVGYDHIVAVAEDLNLKHGLPVKQPATAAVTTASAVPLRAASVQPPLPPLTMQSLERYQPELKQKSILKKWAGWLGLAPKVEQI